MRVVLDRPIEIVMRDSAGNIRHVEQISFSMNTSSGWQLGTSFRDVTERKAAEARHALDEERLEGLLMLSHLEERDPVSILDFALEKAVSLTRSSIGYMVTRDSAGSYVVNTLVNMRGRTTFAGSAVRIVGENEMWRDVTNAMAPLIVNDSMDSSFDIQRYTEGRHDLFRFLGIPVQIDSKIEAVLGVGNKETDYDEADVRQLTLLVDGVWRILSKKKSDEEIRRSLHEKEVLLKEVHHRVKNNLQIVSSLLHLQEKHIRDESDLAVFRDSKDRIKSMALIHEALYQSGNLARIDFDLYARKLVENLFRTYLQSHYSIRMNISAENVTLPVDVAIPCGLIINELVSNSLKYAFPSGGDGVVSVLVAKKSNVFQVEVIDTGVGLPEGFLFENQETLGVSLVKNLVMQLRGTITVKNDPGAHFVITFEDSETE